jgi:hypothetical protein
LEKINKKIKMAVLPPWSWRGRGGEGREGKD